MDAHNDLRPCAVLDTNVVLDWLVFEDPACLELGTAIESGRLRWLASAELRDEFDCVLARGVGASRCPDLAALDSAWQRWAEMLPPAPSLAVATGRRAPCLCSDPDDQKFIDLALHRRADWLLTRDRAVLRVARAARLGGLAIVTPSVWQALVSSQRE